MAALNLSEPEKLARQHLIEQVEAREHGPIDTPLLQTSLDRPTRRRSFGDDPSIRLP